MYSNNNSCTRHRWRTSPVRRTCSLCLQRPARLIAKASQSPRSICIGWALCGFISASYFYRITGKVIRYVSSVLTRRLSALVGPGAASSGELLATAVQAFTPRRALVLEQPIRPGAAIALGQATASIGRSRPSGSRAPLASRSQPLRPLSSRVTS